MYIIRFGSPKLLTIMEYYYNMLAADKMVEQNEIPYFRCPNIHSYYMLILTCTKQMFVLQV